MTILGNGPAAAPRTSTPRTWSFANCVLDESGLELKVAGRVVDLDRKPLEVLLHLLRHAGEVVTKDELVEAVWPGRITTDSNLTKTIAVLRAALGEAGQAAIKTVHGYGYRLVAPVSVRTATVDHLPMRFQFEVGEAAHLRPHWRLAKRLDVGGHGEVWLACHSSLHECRVFKFADADSSLTALKREITLNRLLRETLPARDDFLRLLDWNLEEPPFFVETEYLPCGNLASWIEARGGFAALSLDRRLELVAQIAEALAAAHSVGVLHKDLKPSNVLIVESDGVPRIRLADFGSGGVVDPARIDALGITRMGFTQKIGADGDTSGTPLYLAPEVIAGQPFTVQSDLYALGVMLYQIVAGDFRRSLAPGWEHDIGDELLRDDIARAAAGKPSERLRDAGDLAQRLRSLPARRHELAAVRASRMQAERAVRMRRELRRLRAVAAVLLASAIAATAAGVVAYDARDDARRAATTAKAVNQFLNRDLLARADPTQGATRDLTVRQLIDAAAATVDARFGDQPETAAQVHATLGEAYTQLEAFEPAEKHLRKAIALYSAVHGLTAAQTLDTSVWLAAVLHMTGRRDEACAMTQAINAAFDDQVALDNDRRLIMRAAKIRCLSMAETREIIPEIEAIVASLEQRSMSDHRLYASALHQLAMANFDRMDFVEAEKQHRKLVAFHVRTRGEGHILTARARATHANSLVMVGRVDEADAELARALDASRAWIGDRKGFDNNTSVVTAILRLEQGRFREAEAQARLCLEGAQGRQKRGTFRLAALYVLAESLLGQKRWKEAAKVAEEGAELSRQLDYKQFHEVPARAEWAEALIQQNDVDAAARVLDGITDADLAAMPERNVNLAAFRRSQGLLWVRNGARERGIAALTESRDIYRLRYGPEHWRTKRADAELERLRA